MPGLRDVQHQFLNYLLEKPSSIVDNIESNGNTSAQQRLDLYADGYRLRLKEAISTDYEQLHAYLGDDMFEQLMDEYINHYPSHHPSLRYYSKDIPAFLARGEPWTQAPEIVEIATIEKALCDSFDSANHEARTVQDLADINPDSWPTLKIKLHDSVQLLSLQYNSFPIWQALSEESHPPAVIQEASTWLIWRNNLVSQYRTISDAETDALEIMIAGGNFSDLCEKLLDYYEEEETPQQAIYLLQTWLTNEMVSELF